MEEKNSWWLMFRDLFITFVVAVLLVNGVQAFLIRPFFIPSASMETTLGVGDTVVVNRTSYLFSGVERGDIVVFKDPGHWVGKDNLTPYTKLQTALSYVGLYPKESEIFLVKRVVGLPGEVISSAGDGLLYVNDELLGEDYLPQGELPSLVEFEVVVPEGGYWVMGDNRDNSSDSRFHMNDVMDGAVPFDKIIGKVVYKF